MAREYLKNPDLPEHLKRRLKDDICQKIGNGVMTSSISELSGLRDESLVSRIAFYSSKVMKGEVKPAYLKWIAYIADLDILDDCARFYLRRCNNLSVKIEDSLLELADFKNINEEERLFNEVSRDVVLERAWALGV